MKKHLQVIKSNADTDQQGSISRSSKLKLKQDLGFKPGDNISFEKLAERIQYEEGIEFNKLSRNLMRLKFRLTFGFNVPYEIILSHGWDLYKEIWHKIINNGDVSEWKRISEQESKNVCAPDCTKAHLYIPRKRSESEKNP